MIILRTGKELEQVQKSSAEPVNQKDLIREAEDSMRNISPKVKNRRLIRHQDRQPAAPIESGPDLVPEVKPPVRLYVSSMLSPQRRK